MRAYRPIALLSAIGLVFAIAACSRASIEHKSSIGTLASPSANPSPAGISPSAKPTATAAATKTATTAATKTSATTTDTGPQIITFEVTQQPACPVVATTDAPYGTPGTDIKLKWKVINATGVALSLDAPNYFDTHHTGSYSDYGTSGEVDLSFPCDTNVQPNTTHTYTLDTLGSKDVRKTITVTKQTSP